MDRRREEFGLFLLCGPPWQTSWAAGGGVLVLALSCCFDVRTWSDNDVDKTNPSLFILFLSLPLSG
jgi:hypothetical protein